MDMKGKKRHPAAEKYFQEDYRSMRTDLAQKIFAVFNFSVSGHRLNPSKIEIVFNDQLWTASGIHRVYYRDHESPYRKKSFIYLSIRHLDNPERLRKTLLHELCHAAVYHIDQTMEDGHGPKWHWWVQQVGHKHPNISKITETANYISNKHLYKCIKCFYDVGEKEEIESNKYKGCRKCGEWIIYLVALVDPSFNSNFHINC